MIKALASLGKNNHISITLAYEGDDRVTATVIVKPKKDEKRPKSLQFEGTIDEVEAAVTAQLESVALKITGSQNNIAKLQAELEADEADAKKDRDKKKEKAGGKNSKPETAKPTAAKASPSGKTSRGGKATAPAKAEAPTTAGKATALLDDL